MVKQGEFEDGVREALHREAEAVEPSGDGLQRIQARTAGRAAAKARSRWLAGTAVLATAAAVAAIAVVGTGGIDLGGEDAAPAGPVQTRAVELFFLDSTPERRGEPGSETVDDPGLYRETHEAAVRGDAVETAVRALVSTTPEDLDYVNPWSEVTVSSVDVQGDRVDLGVDEMTPAASRVAAQQALAHTVQAAAGTSQVMRISIQDEQSGTVTAGSLTAADPVGTYAGIWVTSPEQGAAVGSPVTFSGMAATFEGNVAYEILRGEQVVARGATISEGGMGVWSPWSFSERLMPGEYTVVAFDEDPALGGRRDVDTKTFTVQ